MSFSYNAILALLAVVAFTPWGTHAASLYGNESESAAEVETFSQTSLEIDTTIDMDTPVDATGTPSKGSAGDDSETNPGIDSEENLADAQTSLSADAALIRAEIEDNRVVVEYLHAGKLFAFMPVEVKAKTVVSSDESGVVSVATSMPWWNFLVAGTGSTSTMVDGELSASGAVAMDARLATDAARARLLEAIANAHARVALTEEE